jgi:hypothetical protein
MGGTEAIRKVKAGVCCRTLSCTCTISIWSSPRKESLNRQGGERGRL